MKISELFANREPILSPIERIARERDELRELNAQQAQAIARLEAKLKALG